MPDECRRWSDGAANNGNGKRDELVAIFFRVVSDRPHEAGTRAAQLGLGFGNAASTFTKPAAGTEGNEGRNTFRNPGYVSIDASVSKLFRLPWEGVTFRFSFETFNTLNRVNLGAVDATITDATFGRSTTANQARVMELRGRIDF
jgi:hypothetical protein